MDERYYVSRLPRPVSQAGITEIRRISRKKSVEKLATAVQEDPNRETLKPKNSSVRVDWALWEEPTQDQNLPIE